MNARSLAGEGVRYILVGAYNTVFTLAVFWVLDRLWGALMGVQAVYWLSATLGVLNGFVSQRLLVWRATGAWKRELSKFVVVNLAVALVNSGLLFLTVTLWGFAPFPSQLCITAVLVILAFFANRHWVFARRSLDRPETLTEINRSVPEEQ